MLLLGFLVATPLAQAQSKREKRKMEREMKKMKKELEEVREMEFEKAMQYREQALEEAQVAREIEREDAQRTRDMSRDQAERARDMYREQMDKHAENLDRYREQAEKVMVLQTDQLNRLKELYPEGLKKYEYNFKFPDLDLPEFHFEMPEMPEMPELPYLSKEDFARAYRYAMPGENSQNNTMIITKEIDGETMAKTYDYVVKDEAKYLDFSIDGSTEAGSIAIVVKDPSGNTFRSLDINALADVNWRQQLMSKGDEENNIAGKWSISIGAKGAEGKYKIRLLSR